MIKFNDNNILVGYIKQLLTEFNLPCAKPYIKGETVLIKNGLYIKDNYVVKYVADVEKGTKSFLKLFPYTYNSYRTNYVKNLTIDTLLYDSHTHEYFGDYLRFIRDYKKLNLMSLYNCFSDRLVDDLSISINGEFNFNTNDSYKIYAIPVKLNKSYTIAISSDLRYDICCGFYGKSYINDSVTDVLPNQSITINIGDLITELTYKKISGSFFNKPFEYKNLLLDDIKILLEDAYGYSDEQIEKILTYLYEHEDSLKLFIRLPVNNNSSIVVLAVSYVGTNDKYLVDIAKSNNSWSVWKNTYSIINFDPIDDSEIDLSKIPLISSLQLLYLNSNISHPFADRLVEYLCSNAITNLENISDNLKKLQQELMLQYPDNDDLKRSCLSNHYGVWDESYRRYLYSVAKDKSVLDNNFDILGYVDKDLEKALNNLDSVDIYKEDE